MNRTPVTSSNVVSIGYDAESQVLEVEYKGAAVYQYAGVSDGEYQSLASAASKGQHMAQIKNKFSCTKVVA
jgi:hypothetical protein